LMYVDRFSKFFHCWTGQKICKKRSVIVFLTHLKHVSRLSDEIQTLENSENV